MNNNTFLGMLVIALGVLITSYVNIYNMKKTEKEPVEELNKNFIETNKNLAILIEQMKALVKRVDTFEAFISQLKSEITELNSRVDKVEIELEYYKKERG